MSCLPREKRQPIGHSLQQHRRVSEPRQVGVPGEILNELPYGNVVASPQRYALACLGRRKRSRSPSVLRFLRRLFSVNYFSVYADYSCWRIASPNLLSEHRELSAQGLLGYGIS